ncbi:MAG: hypothetical protein MJA83_17345 [Gammaproteobacteria bacterium]|nr:hypothetical protein [Gammaproteobacteria bacterium]
MRTRLTILFLLVISPAALADVDALRAEANTAAAEGRIETAIEKFREVLGEAPEDGAVHYQLGSLLMDNDGDLEEAVTHFNKAAELGFQPLGAAYRLSRIYARQGKKKKALEQLEVMAAGGFGLPNLVEGQADYASLAGNKRYLAALDTFRAARYPCDADPRHHAFDFWIGKWNVSQRGQFAGTNEIMPILGHCTIFENWESASGSKGKSFNFYDPGHDRWRQIWISDTGTFIEFVGEARDGGIFYTAETINPADGSVTHHKFEFTQNDDGSVRQFWQTSTDNKETWNTIWDGHYEKQTEDGD